MRNPAESGQRPAPRVQSPAAVVSAPHSGLAAQASAPIPAGFVTDEKKGERAAETTVARLGVGTSLTLDVVAPVADQQTAGSPSPHCVSKNRNATFFCVKPIEWPEDLSARLWVTSHM